MGFIRFFLYFVFAFTVFSAFIALNFCIGKGGAPTRLLKGVGVRGIVTNLWPGNRLNIKMNCSDPIGGG